MSESSPRPPGRPRSAASRAALLDAAYWQVVERGYGSVTAGAIAAAAGAGKQTLYRWWPSKGRLVLAAFAAKAHERIDRPREAAIRAGEVDMVFNTPYGNSGPRIDGYEIRSAAVGVNIPCVTTVQGASAAVQGIEAGIRGDIGVRSLQELHSALNNGGE